MSVMTFINEHVNWPSEKRSDLSKEIYYLSMT